MYNHRSRGGQGSNGAREGCFVHGERGVERGRGGGPEPRRATGGTVVGKKEDIGLRQAVEFVTTDIFQKNTRKI